MTITTQGWTVLARTNDGVDALKVATDQAHATALAKAARTSDHHMVCISLDGKRLHRWERSPVAGQNLWQKVTVDAIETQGLMREIHRG